MPTPTAPIPEPDAEGLAAARQVAAWYLGDHRWADQLIRVYLNPGPALERLRDEREAL